MKRKVAPEYDVPRRSRHFGGRRGDACGNESGGRLREDRDYQKRKEKRGHQEQGEPHHKKSLTPPGGSYHPGQQQSPDVHHRRRRKLELSSEEEEDEDIVPLTKSIKAARAATSGLEQVTIPIAKTREKQGEGEALPGRDDRPAPVSFEEQPPPLVEQPSLVPEDKSQMTASDDVPVPAANETTPSSEQGPTNVEDDEKPQATDVSPVPPIGIPPPAEAFPPVPKELPILMEGDLEHVWGPTVMPGVDSWKPVMLNYDGQPKQVNIPVGFSGRELTEKECSLLLLGWEDAGVFKPGRYDQNDPEEDAVYRQYRPVFDVLPQTVTFTEEFRCGPLRGLAARTAIGFLFVDTARRIGLLSGADDVDSFQRCKEDLKLLQEAGMDVGIIQKAYRYNLGLQVDYCAHEINHLPAAIQTADEKLAREIQELELWDRKVAVEAQLAALASELQQINQRLEHELAGVGHDLFPGLSKSELEERLVRRQGEKEELEKLVQD